MVFSWIAQQLCKLGKGEFHCRLSISKWHFLSQGHFIISSYFQEECFSLLSAGQSPSSSSNSSAEGSPDQHGPRHSSDGEIGQHGEEGIILTEIGAMKGAIGAAADGNNRTQTDSPGSRSSGWSMGKWASNYDKAY
jgi:hypothetical protein